MFWTVFCAPSARPAHAEPASSATAVYASPLSATVTTAPSANPRITNHWPLAAPDAMTSISAALATASWRIGRSRLATRSDQIPASTRPAAPAIWNATISRPAAAGSQCRSPTR